MFTDLLLVQSKVKAVSVPVFSATMRSVRLQSVEGMTINDYLPVSSTACFSSSGRYFLLLLPVLV